MSASKAIHPPENRVGSHDLVLPAGLQVALHPTVLEMTFNMIDAWAKRGWDSFAPSSRPCASIGLGMQAPGGNVIRMKVGVAGKNPKSTGRFFGIDAVELVNPKKSK